MPLVFLHVRQTRKQRFASMSTFAEYKPLLKPIVIFRNCMFITARKRSLGQGNIFIGVCQEFCSQGGGGVHNFYGGACVIFSGGCA